MGLFRLSKKILKFWNQRAITKTLPGSNDKHLYEYEKAYLTSLIKKNKIILDVGCGDGHFLDFLQKKKFPKRVVGIDFSANMIRKAQKRNLKNSEFFVLNMKNILPLKKKLKIKFDYIVTLRSIINVKNIKKQNKILNSFKFFLKKNGKILCCEPSEDVNKKINIIRKKLNLPKINAPWHNLFINERSFCNQKNLQLVKTHNFTGTYYFFSRVINAIVKKDKNKIPKNNDYLNKLGLSLNQKIFEEYSREKIYEFKIK